MPEHLSFEKAVLGEMYVVLSFKDNAASFTGMVRMEANPNGQGLDAVDVTTHVRTPMRRTNHVYGKFTVDYTLLKVVQHIQKEQTCQSAR